MTKQQLLDTLFKKIATEKITDETALREAWQEIQTKIKTKRQPTAYLSFCSKMRPILRQENPSLTFGEMGKILGERWQALTEEQRQQYISPPLPSSDEDVSTKMIDPSAEERLRQELEALKISELRKLCLNDGLAPATTRAAMIKTILDRRFPVVA